MPEQNGRGKGIHDLDVATYEFNIAKAIPFPRSRTEMYQRKQCRRMDDLADSIWKLFTDLVDSLENVIARGAQGFCLYGK